MHCVIRLTCLQKSKCLCAYIILAVAVAASLICCTLNMKPYWFANTAGSFVVAGSKSGKEELHFLNDDGSYLL